MSSTSSLISKAILIALFFAIGFRFGSRSLTGSDTDYEPDSDEQDKKVPRAEEVIKEEPEEDTEEIADGNLAAVKAGFMQSCKLVLVVRTGIGLKKNDIAAHCADATLACYKALVAKNPKLVRHWELTGQAKIALKGESEDQLLELEAIAKSLNLCARAVYDKSKNPEGTRTVLGIGPAPVDLVNQVTGSLKLL